MGAYCRTHGCLKAECGCDITCDRAHELLQRLTAHEPTPAELADLAAGEDWPQERTVQPAVRASWPKPSRDTPERCKAGREPQGKPKVVPIYGCGYDIHGWFVVHDCCPLAPGEEPPDDYCVWDWYFHEHPEAMDAALAHVREVHTGTVTLEIAPDFSGWHDAFDRAHNTPNGARA